MIDLHYAPTMNSHKVAIMFEETGLEYKLFPYDLLAGEHLTRAFHTLNPNHKTPVIVDHDPADHGGPLAIFESGAILQYLAEKTGKLMPKDFRRREVARQWLTWQVSGLGPMSGQAGHFIRYAPVRIEYAIQRYRMEVLRLLSVLESRLSEVEYLAEEYSIADIACSVFVSNKDVIGVNIEDFPAVNRWRQAIAARPAVVRVIQGKRTATPAAILKSEMKLSQEQWSNVFGERMWAAARGADRIAENMTGPQ